MKAEIKKQVFRKPYWYDNTQIMSLTIKYPKVTIINSPQAQRQIEGQIRNEINDFYGYVSNSLYQEAVKYYMDSKNNNFPFHPFETIMDYTITYNDNCFLSYYYDKYMYTGGAHGTTLRGSSTFELVRGTKIPLYCYFKQGVDYKSFLIAEIIRQAKHRLKDNPGIYFDNYEELIKENFKEDNYFLSRKGLSIYY